MLYHNSGYFSEVVSSWGRESPFAERQYLEPFDDDEPEEYGYSEDDFAEMERDDLI